MIKASELRIGNLVYNKNTNTSGLPDGVVRITGNGIHRIDDGVLHFWGIPLTPEWLLKFGFKPIGTDDFHMDGCLYDRGSEFMLFLRNDGYACFTKYFCEGYGHPSDIGDFRSVHEMQNVFYFIEGEELTIQE